MRKYVAWYLKTRDDTREFRQVFSGVETVEEQVRLVEGYFYQSDARS